MNGIAEGLAAMLLQLLPGLSLVLLAILVLRPWVLARLGAPAAYRLWVLVPLWLAAAAPTLAWPAFTADWLPVSGTAMLLEAVRATASAGPAAGETAEALPAALLVGTFWLIGVAAMLAMLAHRWIGAARLLRDARPTPAQLSEQVPGVADHAIGISDRLTGPTVVGIRQQRILLPADFGERFDPETLTLILRHEAVHLGRRDNLANLFAEILLALMWFNPLAWLARQAFRTDQELSCDSRALAESAGSGRIAYARSLLDLSTSSRGGPDSRALACPWHSMSTLKRRIKMIDIHHPGHFRRLPGLVLLAALAGAAVFVLPMAGASNPEPAQTAALEKSPAILVRIAPKYPAEAAEQRLEGHVTAEFTVTEDGRVEDITVIDSAPGDVFDAAAIEAFARWRFRPAMIDQTPAPARIRQMILFEMDED